MKRFNIGSKYEYCPNGNYWQDVSGLFDKEIYLFCDCPKCQGQVYVLKPRNITKKIDKKIIEEFRQLNKLDKIKSQISLENMSRVSDLLTQKKEDTHAE